MKQNTYRKFVTAVLAAALSMNLPVFAAEPQVPEQSDFFAYAYIESSSTYTAPGSDGDLWPSAWGSDGALYAANGDGAGFSGAFSDIAVSKITGDPGSRNITGQTLTTDLSQIWT